MCRKTSLLIGIILTLYFLFPAISYAARLNKVLVLYPKVSSGYQIIFSSMIEGIKNNLHTSVEIYEVNEDTSPAAIDNWIAQHRGEVLITLGRRSHEIRKTLTTELPYVTGGIIASDDTDNGISLMGDPQRFISMMKTLSPKVKRVHSVYSEENSGWLVPYIMQTAKKRGIEIITYNVDSTQQAALTLQKILLNAETETDALWLLMDRVIPDAVMLPSILETAWKKKLMVFSSNPAHVKRGILFALYPDYKKMGQELAALAMNSQTHQQNPGLLPTKNLRAAINKRTASHLGLYLAPQTIQQMDLVFPTP